jgi:hypothetical protein
MKLYLETTVPNFLFADDAPEKRRVTEVFFRWLEIGTHELFVSDEVELELSRAPSPKREQMRAAMKRLPLDPLRVSVKARELADAYLLAGILPARFETDAVHAAVAVCERLDVVVTWNMKHLANARRVAAMNEVNMRLGFPKIRIETPAEIMGLK